MRDEHLSPEELDSAGRSSPIDPQAPSAHKIQSHLEQCPPCREAWQFLTTLRRPPLNLEGENMARRVRRQVKLRARQLFWARSAAALVAIGLGASSYLHLRQVAAPTASSPHLTQQARQNPPDSPSSSPDQSNPSVPMQEPILRSLQWLKAVRESDGHWSAQRWGGLERFDVAVTSLALIPLLETGDGLNETEVLTSLAYLQGQQRPDGGFGPAFVGDLYNHCISTLAWLQIQKMLPTKVSSNALSMALKFLAAHQCSDGGFAYREGLPAELALSLWAQDVLAQVSSSDPEFLNQRQRLGTWLSARQPAASPLSPTFVPTASRQWLLQYAQGMNPEKQISSVKLDAWPTDIYQAYYCYRSLKLSPQGHAQKMLALLQTHVLNQQEHDGEYAGSWAADGQWGRVGGRVYNTGMALMCLMDRGKS